jgi:hypothetical protein
MSVIAVTVVGMQTATLIVLWFEFTGHVYSGRVGIPKYWHIPAISMFVLGFFAFRPRSSSMSGQAADRRHQVPVGGSNDSVLCPRQRRVSG